MHQSKTASGQGETGPDTDFKDPSFGRGNDLFSFLIALEPLLTLTYHTRAFKKKQIYGLVIRYIDTQQFFHWSDHSAGTGGRSQIPNMIVEVLIYS
jgi:hypothetical protein